MIYKLKGKLVQCEENTVILELAGIFYKINIPKTVYDFLSNEKLENVELIIYHYLNIDKNRGIPVLVGFLEELERDFFEKFISVSGIGPKAALRAFDKPVSTIARAIEEGDMSFLQSLAGVGKQKAKQIIAHLQGKVGRFALIREKEDKHSEPSKNIIVEESMKILKRLQYNTKESEVMIKKVLTSNPQINSVEDFLNEIYRQRI
ncbi:MAG: hypothetical protein KAI91_01750 [Candidatus Omnitrophica bacterium]|nr:hypothetical protein [Candidatus Omnitrophota bacterium]MCK5393032.1 hypothetical protein [Candidatus Omnitrophota bacterium]